MEADNTPIADARQPTAQPPGGAVEPANRATIAKERFQTPVDVPGERYEMRDPFAEVTYRADSLADMVAKAEQLGSSRFTAVGPQGQRTTVQKVDGEWRRDAPREAQRIAQPTPEIQPQATAPVARDTSRSTSNVVPMPTLSAPSPEAASKAIARVDAQAERAALVARLEAALLERYIIKRAPVTVGELTIGHTEYRFRGDTSRVAFTESTFRLATDTNSPSVARSMVDVAEARNWRALRISGNEEFRRMVWLEASVRGVKTLGYEPVPADLEVLNKERETRLLNRIEPARTDGASTTVSTDKVSARGGGGRKAVLAAIEAVLVARRVPEKQRIAVMAAATEQLAQRLRDGQSLKVKVYDKSAPSQRPAVVPTADVQRTRDRAAPVR